jgi:MYXO-CTERM domain-containing protein
MKLFRSSMLALAASVGFTFAAQRSHAAPLVYEGFDYAAGVNALNAKTGGSGFAGAWGNQNADIVAGGFNYTDSNGKQLQTTGNRAYMDASSTAGTSPPEPTGVSISPIRPITPIAGSPSTIYLSFLAQQVAGTDRDVSVSLFAATTGTFGNQERITIGHGNGFTTWGAYALAVGTNGEHGDDPANQLSFLVARIDANANGVNERVRVYVNPTLDAEPVVADVDFDTQNFIDSMADFNRIRMRGGGSNTTQTASQLEADELRLGLTYADVAPVVPEPGSAMLGVMGAAMLAMRRRRRRRCR